jgi:hypothetical protein
MRERSKDNLAQQGDPHLDFNNGVAVLAIENGPLLARCLPAACLVPEYMHLTNLKLRTYRRSPSFGMSLGLSVQPSVAFAYHCHKYYGCAAFSARKIFAMAGTCILQT